MNKMLLGLAAAAMAAGFGGMQVANRALAADAPATATAPSTEPAASSNKFYGAVSAVDATAKTFTVGEQTFVIGAESQLTKGDGTPATIADAAVGEPARGSYATGADGKTLTVTKVRFGKKTGGTGGGKGGKGGGKKKTAEAPAATQQ